MTDGPRSDDFATVCDTRRRQFLQGVAAWTVLGTFADWALTAAAAGETADGTEPFTPELVRKLA